MIHEIDVSQIIKDFDAGQLIRISRTDVHLIKLSKNIDERGEFSRIFDDDHIKGSLPFFADGFKQISLSMNTKKGTLRGLHVQAKPSREAKLVKLIKGRVIDFVVDLRSNSETYLQTVEFHLKDVDPALILVPPGHGHGIFTLEDNSLLLYAMNSNFDRDLDLAINFFDPEIGISLDASISTISEKDQSAPFLNYVRAKLN